MSHDSAFRNCTELKSMLVSHDGCFHNGMFKVRSHTHRVLQTAFEVFSRDLTNTRYGGIVLTALHVQIELSKSAHRNRIS
jgi:hypothetical protein